VLCVYPMNKSPNRWKWAFWGSITILLPIVAILLYAVVDNIVTIDYMTQGYSETKQDFRRLADIYPKNTYTKKDIVYILRQHSPDAFIVETECNVQIDGLRFEFTKDNKFTNIETRATFTPAKPCDDT